MVPGGDRRPRPTARGSDREHVVRRDGQADATVQVGDTERSERSCRASPADRSTGDGDELIVGDTERAVATGLHRLQSGDVAGAVAVLDVAAAAPAARDRPQRCSRRWPWPTPPTATSTARSRRPTRSTPTSGPATSTASSPASPAAWPSAAAATAPPPRPPSTRCGRPPTPPRTACPRRSPASPTRRRRRPGGRPTPRCAGRGGSPPRRARARRHRLAAGVHASPLGASASAASTTRR